jgi:hypothetical protein
MILEMPGASDDWRRTQTDPPSRPEAIRRLIERVAKQELRFIEHLGPEGAFEHRPAQVIYGGF